MRDHGTFVYILVKPHVACDTSQISNRICAICYTQQSMDGIYEETLNGIIGSGQMS
jgi:hypothetical protein